MLGFDPGVAFTFDPILTIGSLIVAIFGSAAGFSLAASRFVPKAPVLGGAFVGLSVGAMHYTGMLGYGVQSIVTWGMPVLLLSIVFAVVLSGMAVRMALRSQTAG